MFPSYVIYANDTQTAHIKAVDGYTLTSDTNLFGAQSQGVANQ
jgi:hypothetical protein